jgi:hypothetical protein
MEEFGFTRPENVYSQANVSLAGSLFPGAAGSMTPMPSTLDPHQQNSINDAWYTETALRELTEDVSLNPPLALHRPSQLENQHHAFIDDFWQVQNHNHAMREKGRGKGQAPQDATPGTPGDATPPVPPIVNTQIDIDNTIDFDGDDMACAL